MNQQRLLRNIIDVIAEEQIKLGYRSEIIYLYYPLKSLNSILGTKSDIKEMNDNLRSFSEYALEYLGEIGISNRDERFCLAIPPKGADYVHEHIDENEFLQSFIDIISKHGCTLEDITDVFKKYSDDVTIKKMEDADFDYLIYFTDGKPNDYMYCITFEGHHTIYHRFTVDDYISFGYQL